MSQQQNQVDSQPTVRVMRLYKPSLHINSVIPYLPFRDDTDVKLGCEFSISQVVIFEDFI